MSKRPGGELAARQLHFIWIADCSGSMGVDGKIEALNNAIDEAVPHMRIANPDGDRDDGRGHDCRDGYARRNRSHRNTGPPTKAVMTPTGSSTGASAVRATRSQPIRNAAPKSTDAGSTSR